MKNRKTIGAVVFWIVVGLLAVAILPFAALGAATNLPPASTLPVVTDTNGVLVAPSAGSFADSNGLARTASLKSAAYSNGTDFAASSHTHPVGSVYWTGEELSTNILTVTGCSIDYLNDVYYHDGYGMFYGTHYIESLNHNNCIKPVSNGWVLVAETAPYGVYVNTNAQPWVGQWLSYDSTTNLAMLVGDEFVLTNSGPDAYSACSGYYELYLSTGVWYYAENGSVFDQSGTGYGPDSTPADVTDWSYIFVEYMPLPTVERTLASVDNYFTDSLGLYAPTGTLGAAAYRETGSFVLSTNGTATGLIANGLISTNPAFAGIATNAGSWTAGAESMSNLIIRSSGIIATGAVSITGSLTTTGLVATASADIPESAWGSGTGVHLPTNTAVSIATGSPVCRVGTFPNAAEFTYTIFIPTNVNSWIVGQPSTVVTNLGVSAGCTYASGGGDTASIYSPLKAADVYTNNAWGSSSYGWWVQGSIVTNIQIASGATPPRGAQITYPMLKNQYSANAFSNLSVYIHVRLRKP